MRFVALDFETSGLDPKRHAPVTLGVALFDGGEVQSSSEWMFAPPTDKNGRISREYDVCALEISGKSWSALKRDGQAVGTVCAELRGWVHDQEAHTLPVVAFNAAFDLAFYSELLFMAGCWNQLERRFEGFAPPLAGPWQCARMLAIHRLGIDAMGKWNLDSVAAHFGLSRSTDLHGALEDAILAGRVFDALEAVPA